MLLSAADARAIILNNISPPAAVTVGLGHALHACLAIDIRATVDVPAFDNSQMDGYAVRSADAGAAPVTMRVSGEIAAGAVAAAPLAPHETMRIMTGAKIPEGCDAVIQQEWAEAKGGDSVTFTKTVQPGHNIRRAGADIRAGTTVLSRGRRLRPQEIGVLASLGEEFVSVFRRPSVAILPTGNEVTALGKTLLPGRVRNSNAYTLGALVRELECDAVQLDIAADTAGELNAGIQKGMREDILVTTGGVSVGKYDLVKEALESLGLEVLFWKVNIKPGMPLLFGLLNGKPVFALPGNPVSTMVTFLQFVKPAIEKMSGLPAEERPVRRARLSHEYAKKDGKRHYLRGILAEENGATVVRTTGPQVSNVMTSLALANCLIIIPEERELVRAGEEVEIEML
jgi:molybdopterin molybdotransferase